ncbi:MAG TPA: response regulator [Burkholderiales bacterium]|nr:response regulator [Burkholderiales bacterium]
MNLLLVDDDPKNLFALSALLEDLGAALHCARSGEEALREVLKRDFAAILLDVRMPGIDGFETAAAIRSVEHLRRTPIIFLSAHADRRARQRDPLCLFVDKPVDPERIRQLVKKLAA